MWSYIQLLPSGPVYALDTDDAYECTLSTAFHQEKIAKGNATIRVLVKPFNSSDPFRFVKEEYFPWVISYS